MAEMDEHAKRQAEMDEAAEYLLRRCYFYCYRDPEGKEWGPFTDGQLCSLLNRGILTRDSLLRAEGEQEWRTYYARQPRSPARSAAEYDSFELDLKLLQGDRVARELEMHVARKRMSERLGVRPSLASLDFDPDFAADEMGYIYAGCEPIAGASNGVRLSYEATAGRSATIDILPDSNLSNWLINEGQLLTFFARQVHQCIQMADQGHYRFMQVEKFGWLETKIAEASFRHAWFRFTHLGARNDTILEQTCVTLLRGFFLKHHFTYMKGLEGLGEFQHLLRFLELSIGTLRASKFPISTRPE